MATLIFQILKDAAVRTVEKLGSPSRFAGPMGLKLKGTLLLLFGLNFLLLCWFTWARWGNLLVDSYQSMYIFSALARGAMLYRDHAYYYGPFAPYLHAALFRLFGEHLLLLYLAGLTSILATSWLIYLLLNELGFSRLAWVAAFIFLNLLAFNNYHAVRLFNFALPYNFSSTYAALFVLAAFLFQLKVDQAPTQLNLFTWSVVSALVWFNRPELGAIYTAIILFWILYRFGLRSEPGQKVFKYFLAPLLVLILLVYGYFAYQTGAATLLFHNLFWFGHIPGFYDQNQAYITGIDPQQIRITFFVFGLRLFSLLPVVATAMPAWSQENRAKIAFGLTAVGPLLFHGLVPFDQTFADTFLITALGVYLLWKKPNITPQRGPLLCLGVYSLFPLIRIMFRTTLKSYFFYLGIAPMVLLLALVGAIFRKTDSPTRATLVSYAFFFLLPLLPRAWMQNYTHYRLLQKRIETQKGVIYVQGSSNISRCLFEATEYINAFIPKEGGLLVVPEGAGVNFLTGKASPFYFPTIQPHVVRAYGEESIIRHLKKSAPRYIVCPHQYTFTFGNTRLFGRDYAQRIADWLESHYRLIWACGPPPFLAGNQHDGGVVLLERLEKKGIAKKHAQ